VRPLVKRLLDGRSYIVPTVKPPRPKYTPAVLPPASWVDGPKPAPQATSDTASGPEPTPKPEHSRRRKLTDDDVRSIRADYAAGRFNQAELAHIDSVSKNAISRIVRTLDYTNVTPTKQES
jgi:hypothetical protein